MQPSQRSPILLGAYRQGSGFSATFCYVGTLVCWGLGFRVRCWSVYIIIVSYGTVASVQCTYGMAVFRALSPTETPRVGKIMAQNIQI